MPHAPDAISAIARHVRAALGLHPQLVKERALELGIWRDALPRARDVNEISLDAGPANYASFETQKAVFKTILRDCAAQGRTIRRSIASAP